MAAAVFREKSLERMKSPEKLDEYIRVSNPSVWVILGAILLLLVGGVVWACAGTIAERAQAIVVVSGGQATAYVSQANAEDVSSGQTVEISQSISGARVDGQGILSEMSDQPVSVSSIGSSVAASDVSELLDSPSWLVSASVSTTSTLADGVYEGSVITQTYQPIALLFGGA